MLVSSTEVFPQNHPLSRSTSSENKGADQLRGYCEADLRLCFRIGKNPIFSRCSSNSARNDLMRLKKTILMYHGQTCITDVQNMSGEKCQRNYHVIHKGSNLKNECAEKSHQSGIFGIARD